MQNALIIELKSNYYALSIMVLTMLTIINKTHMGGPGWNDTKDTQNKILMHLLFG